MAHTKVLQAISCAICERSLLLGEETARFSPDGREFVDVCALCREKALEMGWLREGLASLPLAQAAERRGRGLLAALFRSREPAEAVAEPILRRLSQPEQAIVEAAELFNASAFRRTVEGITRSLGWPRASIVPLSGKNPEVVITIAWDISWYQYRVDFDSSQPVRLAERGYEPEEEIERSFKQWNAYLNDDGLLVPEISPV